MTIGMADGGRISRLPEQSGIGPEPGFYEAWLAPELGIDLADLQRDGVTVGFLIPAGDRTMELIAPGYERQPAELRASAEGALVMNSVEFGAGGETWPRLWGAALFDGDGTVIAKGPLTLKKAGLTYARLCFIMHGIVVVLNKDGVDA